MMQPTPESKHPLEASKSWALYTQRQQAGEEQPEDSSFRRILKKTKTNHNAKKHHETDSDDDLIQHPDSGEGLDIQVSHKPRKHKIPKVGGSTMHGIMIDAGSVRNRTQQSKNF